MAEHDNPSPKEGSQPFKHRYRWLLITTLALVIHGFGAFFMYMLVKIEGGALHQKERVRVDLVDIEPKPPPPEPAVEPEQPRKVVRKAKRARPRISEESVTESMDTEPTKDTEKAEAPVDSRSPTVNDLPELDLKSSRRIFAQIASEDARIRRMLDKPEDGMFAPKKGPSKFNLPPDLKHDDIRRSIETGWNPDWSQIKDDGIAKVSGKWVGDGMKNWFLNYQEQVKEMGAPDRITDENVDEILVVQNSNYTMNRVSVKIDLEPLHNGSYAASISKSSGHPFFDRAALAQIKEMSTHFPPWEEGYGHILRYRLDATFTIVPPSASTLLGLSCAFPFCTPDELKELEVIHWFKKMVDKNVYFEGIIAPPPLADGGP